jgi:3',5'-cyclic AMP phosphodiesterase CpdA
LKYIDVPIFFVPGNHELTINEVNGKVIDGRDYWDATYGPMYNSFDYDGLHVVGINTFDWAAKWRDERNKEAQSTKVDDFSLIGNEQWEWLQKDFADASARGKNIIAYTHIPIDLLQGGRKIGLKNPETAEGPSVQKFTKFLNHYNVSHIFIGHMHMNSERKLGSNTLEVLTLGAGIHIPGNADPKWGYRIIHVKSGAVSGTDVREFSVK